MTVTLKVTVTFYLFDPIKNMIEHFLAHIKDRTIFRDGFLRHPLRQTIIFGSEACALVEFAFQLESLLAKFLQNIIRKIVPAITCFQQSFHYAIGRSGVTKACKDSRAQRVIASHVQMRIE